MVAPVSKIRIYQRVEKAGGEECTFHDLRHTAINKRRLQGYDYFRIMAETSPKT